MNISDVLASIAIVISLGTYIATRRDTILQSKELNLQKILIQKNIVLNTILKLQDVDRIRAKYVAGKNNNIAAEEAKKNEEITGLISSLIKEQNNNIAQLENLYKEIDMLNTISYSFARHEISKKLDSAQAKAEHIVTTTERVEAFGKSFFA